LSSEHVTATHGAYHDIRRAGQSRNNLIGDALDALKKVRIDRCPDKAEIVVKASSHYSKEILECLWTMGKDAFDRDYLGACGQGLAQFGGWIARLQQNKAFQSGGCGVGRDGGGRIPGRRGQHSLSPRFLSQCNSERTRPVFEGSAWISTLVFEIEILQAKSRAKAARSDERSVSFSQKRNRRRDRKHRTISVNSRTWIDLLKLEKRGVRVTGFKNATTIGTAP
jgi:hypothetical protein